MCELWGGHVRVVPIIPLVVTFAPGKKGLSTEQFVLEPLGEPVLCLRYRHFCVAAMSAARFLRDGNPSR